MSTQWLSAGFRERHESRVGSDRMSFGEGRAVRWKAPATDDAEEQHYCERKSKSLSWRMLKTQWELREGD